ARPGGGAGGRPPTRHGRRPPPRRPHPRSEVNTMPLDPQAKLLIEQMEALGLPPTEERTVEQARVLSRQRRAMRPEVPEPVARVEDRRIPGPHGEIPVRIYTPEGAGPFPVLVYFHGGGWVICDLDSHDGVCRSLTRRTGCLTVSID